MVRRKVEESIEPEESRGVEMVANPWARGPKKERRNEIEIIVDILESINQSGRGIKPTHLMYKSNLSYKRLKKYALALAKKNAITEVHARDGVLLQLTDEGRRLLVEYKRVKDFVNTFGL